MEFIRGIASATFLLFNTLFWCSLLYIFVLLKVIVPIAKVRSLCDSVMERIAENFIACNSAALDILLNIHWTVNGLEKIERNRSYLVCANHQSWTDIVVLQKVLNRRIPFLRFFIKQELVYVPLLGLAWIALEFPRMKRHSKEFLAKHPERRGEDLETTRRACSRLHGKPVSILNFLEGTRFTRKKHARQESPFTHLLRPKTGGFAFVIGAMGDQFHSLLDITILYPKGVVTLWGLLKGSLSDVIVDVREIPIPRGLIGGNYLEDASCREDMQSWVRNLWEEKDRRIGELRGAGR